MANQISGKVIAVSNIENVPSKVAGKQPTMLRHLWLDCTRYDPFTGERSQYENKPMLDFKGENTKLLDGVKQGDIVTVSFDISGYEYKDENGKMKVFTSIRPYGIQVRQQQQQQKNNENDGMPF